MLIIIRVIPFELVQPICTRYFIVTEGRTNRWTDGRVTIAIPRWHHVHCAVKVTDVLCKTLQVYWLPPEAGEKVSLGVTVLLAFSVFQLVISDSTPENSDVTPLLSK